MYGQAVSDICFASSAVDFLDIVTKSPQYNLETGAARKEKRAMIACLERLAKNEKGDE